MKKHSILSLLIAFSLCFLMLVPGVAKTPAAGDVDGSGKIEASDARLALRFSVKLEKLTAQQIAVADVDSTDGVSASDARLILRASVGLETLKLKDNGNKEFNGHRVNNDCIGIETGIICTDSDCCGKTLVPSFNELVNALKAEGSLNYQSGYSKTVTTTHKAKATANNVLNLGLAKVFQTMLNEGIKEGSETSYSVMTKNRHINSSNFYVFGEDYVSSLKEDDIKSITMTKMNGVDFVKALPDSYTVTETGAKVNLKDIKESDIGEVYKVSVTLFPETLSNGKIPAETTPVEKILNADYNEGLKGTFDGLEDAFKDSPGMADFMGMEMAIVTDCRVDYYFTADSFEPVCARYYVVMNMKNTTNVYINDDGEKQSTPTVSIAINADTVQDSYYFFNDHFNVK